MYKLYHYPVCPFSVMIRFIFNELSIEYILIEEKFWDPSEKFLQMNYMGNLPVLVSKEGKVLNHYTLILEYILKTPSKDVLFPETINSLDAKKVCLWFNEKFYHDCSKFFLQEKLVNFLSSNSSPNNNVLSLARYNLSVHFEYISYLLSKNTWLAGEKFSIADITAAAHILVLDFFGEIPWGKIPEIKDWYCIIKSRPSFRNFLKERISGIITPPYYSQLDF